MADPEVLEALQRAKLPTKGRVRLFHATTAGDAEAIKSSGRPKGDGLGQAWLASTADIAALHNAGGACRRRWKTDPPSPVEI